jgi:Na+/H+-dicarboxylate symporter
MGRTATNVNGNSLATAVVAKWEGQLGDSPAPGPAMVAQPEPEAERHERKTAVA